MMMKNRPGLNGLISWPCRELGRAAGISKDRAARALQELEEKGWIVVTRVALFGSRNGGARYALTMFPNDADGKPASFAFEAWTEK